ncbi:uncharacterized protein LOC108033566 [Drosophila biarmipes]|uniref:uncharacterized protein LOC108033566 n=1 Tax=Drosophila biarmipes TaxID=125945 RepID=UPI0007E5F3DF|nr:uncharacterized protein LOC108033566 [Drosophila biarmipes]
MFIFNKLFFLSISLVNMNLGILADSLKNKFCKPSEVKELCLEKNTWAFDQKTKTCNPVIRTKEPCGFFNNEKACEDFCLKKEKKGFVEERLQSMEKNRKR